MTLKWTPLSYSPPNQLEDRGGGLYSILAASTTIIPINHKWRYLDILPEDKLPEYWVHPDIRVIRKLILRHSPEDREQTLQELSKCVFIQVQEIDGLTLINDLDEPANISWLRSISTIKEIDRCWLAEVMELVPVYAKTGIILHQLPNIHYLYPIPGKSFSNQIYRISTLGELEIPLVPTQGRGAAVRAGEEICHLHLSNYPISLALAA